MLSNSASAEPEIGLPARIWAGLLPGKNRSRCFPGSSPAQIRPGRPISGPESLLRNIKYIRTGTLIRKLKCIFFFWPFLGRFPAKFGPGTLTIGSGCYLKRLRLRTI